MKKSLLLLAAGLMAATAAQAQLTIYTENFESNVSGDTPVAGTSLGYVIGKKVYESTYTSTVDEWFVNTAVSASQAVVQTGQSGAAQGANVLKTIPDYGWAPDYANNQIVDTFVYAGIDVTAPMIADPFITFTFDYKAWPDAEGGLVDPQFNQIFIEVLNPADNWNGVVSSNLIVNATDDSWTEGASLSISTSAMAAGMRMQWGFISQSVDSGGYTGGAMAVDNLNVSTSAVPEPSTFAFLGGFAALGFVVYRRRKQARL